MDTIKGTGEYTFKDTGEKYTFEYSYPVYDSLDEAVEGISETKVLAMLNQTSKEDNANTARENTKRANRHSTEKALSPEQKEANKAQARENRQLLRMLKDNPELLAQLKGN